MHMPGPDCTDAQSGMGMRSSHVINISFVMIRVKLFMYTRNEYPI